MALQNEAELQPNVGEAPATTTPIDSNSGSNLNPTELPAEIPTTQLASTEQLTTELPATELLTTELPPADSFLDQIPQPLIDAYTLGGPVSAILVFLSFIALTIIIFKSIEISRERARDKRKIRKALTLWHRSNHQEAAYTLSKSKKGLGHILWFAMQGTTAIAKTGAHSETVVREEVQRLASATVERLQSHLKTLENIGTISPLLGLFGTVLGMIEAFRQMEQAGSQVDPAVLSGGIWQALLTTGVGLAVAIPTVLAHQWLERRVDNHIHRIEDATTQVFTSTAVRNITHPEHQPTRRTRLAHAS